MKSPHFFKVYSRLGLINAPIHSHELNIGVEDAPDFILSEEFLFQIPDCKVSAFIFPDPRNISPEDYFKVLRLHLEGVKLKINKNLKVSETQIVIGGDNCVTFSSLLAIQERMKNPLNLGYIQFDSHGECNKLSTSPSGNFHGMYMRPFYSSDFEVSEINDLVKSQIPVGNVVCIGNLELDGMEPEFFKKKKIRVINRLEYLGNQQKIKDELTKFIQKFEHIHINFDVDVMDQAITPATGIPTKNGFFPQEIFPLLEIVRKHPDWSLDLVEVNPKKEGADQTIKFAQEVIKFLLEK